LQTLAMGSMEARQFYGAARGSVSIYNEVVCPILNLEIRSDVE
jgi:hypothetical protein